ncbi:MAG TPA: hypothetical protein VMT96_00290 [Candidatus Bathyarchaeia archaeon]|nr:hypothetical protein [Candidatus Bathyarchaeia archaeon]
MAVRPNPAEATVAEQDYDKKFNRHADQDARDIKDQEKSPDATWKTDTKKKRADIKNDSKATKKGRFGFVGRRAGAVRSGSAFMFVIAMIGLGVAYTSVFAPNILLVNIKEMYTNDLSDATIALDAYYKKMMNYKIGHSNCGDQQDIKCKLSTMPQALVNSFQKYGFTVLGTQVNTSSTDAGQQKQCQQSPTGGIGTGGISSGNTDGSIQNCRYQVSAIIPPANANPIPIATGDMLWAYSKLSSANKALVYGVFNPKSSFFMDKKFQEELKEKYDLTKTMTVSGNTEQEVNQSFDNSVNSGGGGIGLDARPSTSGGISLGALRNPVTAAQFLAAMQPLANEANSFVGIQCSWYSYAKAVTNDAKTAKAHTLARFAMQYLKAADAIKVGTSDDITINTLSSKLAQDASGGYGTGNATDSSMYKSIVYGNLPIPSPFGLLYSEDTFDLIAALAPAWSQIMASAAAEGTASNVSGSLVMPPANLTGNDRQYCLDGETTQNQNAIKSNEEEKCAPEITASAPPGFEEALTDVLLLGRQNCPPPHYDDQDHTYEGQYLLMPPVKATANQLSSYVSGLFSANVSIWAAAESLLFTSQTKGVAASDAIFAGTGEILGDMAMSRGMIPVNLSGIAGATLYFAQKQNVENDYAQVAQYNARKTPFDIYNKYSFLGSIVHGISPSYNDKTPLFSALTNGLSLLGTSIKRLDPSANAIYYLQPDPFNPIRLSCPDPEYLAIQITADTECNVRYFMGPQEIAAQPNSVLDYMEKSHSDLTQSNIDELQQRLAQATGTEGDQANIARMLTAAQTAADQPEIDKKTGKAIPGSEYDKYLQYCVNRQDPWGRSAIAVTRTTIPDQLKQQRENDKDQNGAAVSPSDSGDPYQQILIADFPSITEGAKADQDWYTGKKCLENSNELTNFRAYTMMCSVDGSFSGGVDCTDNDNPGWAAYSDNFYTGNDILYLSWY